MALEEILECAKEEALAEAAGSGEKVMRPLLLEPDCEAGIVDVVVVVQA